MEDENLTQLKAVYDELWIDAKSMIKDMNSNIKVVFLFGLTMFAIAPMQLGTVVQMHSRITAGSTRWLDYFYLGMTAISSVISFIAGVGMIRWYFKLKNKYARLIQLEKTLED